MSGRGTMRNGKGGTHRPKRPRVTSGREGSELEELLGALSKQIASAESYLGSEVERLSQEEGNGREVAALLKALYEIRREAQRERQGRERHGESSAPKGDWLGSGVEPEG